MECEEGNLRHLLQEKIEELKRTKDELNRVKDEATQSWLDSRPLIDELERLKQELADAEKRSSMTHSAFLELETELLAINKADREKMEEELKASNMINETILAIDQTRDELGELKAAKHNEHIVRLSMKQNLKLKRQTLRSLKLGLRAVRIESEGLQASAAKALHYISISDTDDTVKLTEKEYYEMKKREREETSLANWRITIAEDQKLAVEENRAKVIIRLKETRSKKGSGKVKEKGLEDEETIGERRPRSVKGKGITDQETEHKKGFRGVKDKKIAGEESGGEKGSSSEKRKGLADKDEEGKKRSRKLTYEKLSDEETEAETRTAGEWSSQGNEPISNRQFASAETSALKIYGSNSMRRWQPFRFSSRKCITKIYPSMVGMIRKSSSPIRKLFGWISTKPCRKPQVKHS